MMIDNALLQHEFRADQQGIEGKEGCGMVGGMVVAPVGRMEGEHLPECLSCEGKRCNETGGRRTKVSYAKPGRQGCHVQEKT